MLSTTNDERDSEVPQYQVLLHPASLAKARSYRQALAKGGSRHAGQRLQTQLAGIDIEATSDEHFLECLFATKPPQIFAESAVYGDGRDWNQDELSILGDVGVAVSVMAFDVGSHGRNPTIHPTPVPATLLFIPGALLQNGTRNTPADWAEVTRDGKIAPAAFHALYERRLLPLFLYANDRAAKDGRKALITLPGLGCGQFAGPFYGQLGAHLNDALKTLLRKHADELPHVQAVYYDPYSECQNERHEFGNLSLLVRPLSQGNQAKPQLCEPRRYEEAGDDFGECLLFSVVAWDHVSWPGNDFYCGSRRTDDGVKAAATSSMQAMTGVEGTYDPVSHCYNPPRAFRDWAQVVLDKKLRMRVEGNLLVLG